MAVVLDLLTQILLQGTFREGEGESFLAEKEGLLSYG